MKVFFSLNDIKRFLKESGINLLILFVAALTLKVIFEERVKEIGIGEWILISLSVVGILVIIGLFIKNYYSVQFENAISEMNTIIEKQKSVVENIIELRNGISNTPWLKLNDEYAQIELNPIGGTIYVISPDLENIESNDDIRNVVITNLKNGINYTYYTPYHGDEEAGLADFNPDLPLNQRWDNLVKEYKQLDSRTKGTLLRKTISKKNFDIFLETHIVIMNVYSKERYAYLQLPVNESSVNKKTSYWIQINKLATEDFYKNFCTIKSLITENASD